MSKLEIWFPCKPFQVTQAWGISNPTYNQYGFSRHNGVDFKPHWNDVTFDLYCPLKMEVTEVMFNDGAGNYIRFVSVDKWLVEGVECYVGGMIMHMKQQAVSVGQIVDVGQFLGVANNTGTSTGPHTHLSLYRLSQKENIPQNRLDTDPTTNYTFNPQPFWSGYHAQDYGVVMKIYVAILNLLKLALSTGK